MRAELNKYRVYHSCWILRAREKGKRYVLPVHHANRSTLNEKKIGRTWEKQLLCKALIFALNNCILQVNAERSIHYNLCWENGKCAWWRHSKRGKIMLSCSSKVRPLENSRLHRSRWQQGKAQGLKLFFRCSPKSWWFVFVSCFFLSAKAVL